jgi:hypothetical protein
VEAAVVPEVQSGVKETEFMGFPLVSLEKKKVAARFGYMAINLYEPPSSATWGKYNDRKVSGNHVRTLVTDFKRTVENCNEMDCIEVALRPEWLSNGDKVLKTIEGLTIDDVPVMEFTVDGEAAMVAEKLTMLGGNHRRHALKKHIVWMDGRIENEEKRLKQTPSEEVETVHAIGGIIADLKRDRDRACRWAVRIFDVGE